MATAIKLRRDTAANWQSVNPMLQLGEIGLETDTRKWKFGDGINSWGNLQYADPKFFTELVDGPGGFSGHGTNLVSVKSDESGLEYTPRGGTGGGGGTTVYSGMATLASGSVVVPAPWIFPNGIVVVTPQDFDPNTPNEIYVKPSDIVSATSFTIRSQDAADNRSVYWMGIPGTPSLDTYYISFKVRFAAPEVANSSGSAGIFRFNVDLSVLPENYAADFTLHIGNGQGTNYVSMGWWSDVAGAAGTIYQDYTVSIPQDTWVVVDLKLAFNVDHTSCDTTVRLNGTVLSTATTTFSTPWAPMHTNNYLLGIAEDHGNYPRNRDFDYFTIGTSDWGSTEIANAQFTTDFSPFDSLLDQTAQGNIGVDTFNGLLHTESPVVTPTQNPGRVCAVKNLT
jgi:Major tropism determinant N-terminal domain